MSDYKPIHTPTYTQADMDRMRQETRLAAFREALAAIAVLPMQGTRRGYEEGVRDALRTLEAAANSAPEDSQNHHTECSWCLAHPHREACSADCERARRAANSVPG